MYDIDLYKTPNSSPPLPPPQIGSTPDPLLQLSPVNSIFYLQHPHIFNILKWRMDFAQNESAYGQLPFPAMVFLLPSSHRLGVVTAHCIGVRSTNFLYFPIAGLLSWASSILFIFQVFFLGFSPSYIGLQISWLVHNEGLPYRRRFES